MSVWFVNRVCRVVADSKTLRDKVSLNVYLSFHFIHCSCKKSQTGREVRVKFQGQISIDVLRVSLNLVYEPG